jgi:hypothetical protein
MATPPSPPGRCSPSAASIIGKEGDSRVLDYQLPPDGQERLLASARFFAENIGRSGY